MYRIRTKLDPTLVSPESKPQSFRSSGPRLWARCDKDVQRESAATRTCSPLRAGEEAPKGDVVPLGDGMPESKVGTTPRPGIIPDLHPVSEAAQGPGNDLPDNDPTRPARSVGCSRSQIEPTTWD
ncbi:hypothetical protein BDZ94DRAFT_1298299 [Collybia nuda]|uniref:Uncharacterized protein n=1 Tax=Collybia nuda TaxID=64659 RepID=A0A9P5Y6Y9_9AGAR|nr:hypothetical protein BDZ94DRAFT_1298299 [Collybia nuda]